MNTIHYELIGSTPWCDQYRDDLEVLMDHALAGDADAEAIVVNCAAHFYGLSIWDFESVEDLVLAIREIDYALESK